jgi:hypothetical protein
LTIAFYVSGHGLGHASRDIELMAELLRRRPDLRIEVRTRAADWIFDRIRGSQVDVQVCQADTGMVQVDSLHIDVDQSAREAAVFYQDFDRRVRAEAERLRQIDARLVIADAPPLACAAAHAAGVPAIVVANFTWDWIYAYYPEFDEVAPEVVPLVAAAYSTAVKALRLPLAGGFESMTSVVEDVPFIARRSHLDRAETRRILGVDQERPLVLSSLGKLGTRLPHDRVAGSGLEVVAFEEHPPEGIRYEDLVAAADVVLSKPGYGIVSECVANRTAFLYTSRGRFAEYEVMIEEMPRLLRCRYIDEADLMAGRWLDAVEWLLAQEEPGPPARVDGATVAAAAILELIPSRR